jgi:hypothetical protein
MGTWTMPFDGTGLPGLLPARKAAARASAIAHAHTANLGSATPAPSRQVAERRGEAMRRFFPKLSAWLAHRAYAAQMQEVEGYLAQAADLCDLENRIRYVERKGFVGPFR